MLIAISIFQFVHGRKMSSSNYKFFFERDFAQQPKSALILTTLHVLFDTLYVNCNDQIMALAATICFDLKRDFVQESICSWSYINYMYNFTLCMVME